MAVVDVTVGHPIVISMRGSCLVAVQLGQAGYANSRTHRLDLSASTWRVSTIHMPFVLPFCIRRDAILCTSGRCHPTANTLFRWKSWRRAAAHTGGAPLDGRERIPRYPSHSPHPATRISKGVLPSSECPSRLNRRSTQTHFRST